MSTEPSNRLYVSNLNWEIPDESLAATFGEHGAVEEARIVRDTRSGRSRGYGFVTFATEAEATAALNALNGAALNEREIGVDYATSTGPKESGEGDGKKKRGPRKNRLKEENDTLKAKVAELEARIAELEK